MKGLAFSSFATVLGCILSHATAMASMTSHTHYSALYDDACVLV
jgi:hypothetical protein